MKTSGLFVRWLLAPVGILALSAAVAAGCAHPFATRRTSTSPEGVRLTIRDQQCLASPDASDQRKTADLVIDLEISNPSSTKLVVQKGAMQVIDTDGGSMTRRGTAQSVPLEVAAGGNQSIKMHFLGSADHCCSSRLSLEPTGVTLGDRALAIERINFVPACLY